MWQRLLRRLRERVRAGRYVVTVHAEEEMTQDDLMASDVEYCILTGSIRRRLFDRTTGERKWIVRGRSTGGKEMETVVRFGPTGMVVVITVYVLWEGQVERDL